MSAFYRARIIFIRGPLAGSPGATFAGVIQSSPDAVLWTDVPGTSVTTVNTQTTMDVGPVVRYLRVKVTLTGDSSAVAAITVSVAGTLERRVEQ